ncbi:tetratricopeptide repeat protein [Brachyspira hampsonii]|uniref:tetratricopeptide repeat protein n=1 Tax=Brachyspira hampsonii TaxID=1287055 RepID=UPI000A7FC523|nr:tetratricopeptide repeat protein [Brachyspira hampsonii]
MDFNLPMPYDKDLTEEEKTAIDKYVDKVYEEFKDNGKQLTRLAAQASSAISAGKAKAEKLANQGFLKNLWGNITGKNRKLRGEIDRDFAISQQACIKMIQKLAQQGKLTFDAIMGVNLKLNCLVTQIDKEFNKVYSQMHEMMIVSMSNLTRESIRIDKLERSMNVVHLESTIEYLGFDGVLYKDLENNNEKMLCIISDFFLATKGKYSINDLMMLKPMMNNIGINPNDKISMISLYNTLLSNKKIADKFFEALDKAKLNELEDIEVPLLGNIKKIEKLETDEKYIVDSIVDMSGKDEKEVKLNLLKNYAASNLNMDLEKENSYFDLSVAMINELTDIDLVEIEEKEETPKISASVNLIFDLAVELEEEENPEGSLYLLEKAKEHGLDTAELYEAIGKALFDLEEYEEAAENFELSIEKGLYNHATNYFTAMSYVYAGNPKKAKEAMTKAVKLKPNSYAANINLGVIYRKLGEYSKAVEYYDKAIKINNEIPLAFINKAEALIASGENRFLIEEALNRAISLNPSYADGLKTTTGTFYKDLSGRLRYSYYKDNNSSDNLVIKKEKKTKKNNGFFSYIDFFNNL